MVWNKKLSGRALSWLSTSNYKDDSHLSIEGGEGRISHVYDLTRKEVQPHQLLLDTQRREFLLRCYMISITRSSDFGMPCTLSCIPVLVVEGKADKTVLHEFTTWRHGPSRSRWTGIPWNGSSQKILKWVDSIALPMQFFGQRSMQRRGDCIPFVVLGYLRIQIVNLIGSHVPESSLMYPRPTIYARETGICAWKCLHSKFCRLGPHFQVLSSWFRITEGYDGNTWQQPGGLTI